MYTATYSPDDNKLRLYSSSRLDKELYLKVREMGFIYAPKQELFVAPMWTPRREDFLIELCGEIEDEDKSLTDRQEERAKRFDNYSSKRKDEANRAHEQVSRITEHIPLGQPILIGHHSEKRARKDAQKIENGMRNAVRLWETSEYWTQRAAGAIHHAKYKELPRVRVNRIKRIEADKRKQERTIKESEKYLSMWEELEVITFERAKAITNYDYISKCFTLEKFPRQTPEASKYEGMMSLYSALDGIITPDQAKEIAVKAHKNVLSWADRWIKHFENRLLYEKAMLNEQGQSDLLKPKAKPAQLPICNYKTDFIIVNDRWNKGEFSKLEQIEMTKDEYRTGPEDYRGMRIVENSHRVRVKLIRKPGKEYFQREEFCVFLTDSKIHEKPEPIERKPIQPKLTPAKIYTPEPESEEKKKFESLKDSLKEGVQVVTAPQLFPTPQGIVEKMIDFLELSPGQSVLEPSAGTGNIIKEIINNYDVELTAVEINLLLSKLLENNFPCKVLNADFLQCNGELGKFDRIIMNPPFQNADDIKHILHAVNHLDDGGILVSLCANGSRQQEALKPLADYWEVLPEGSFKEVGTNVNVSLLVIRKY